MQMKYEDIPRTADERATLVAFLEWQRSTLARKCAVLTAEQLRRRSAAPSTLSLLGLVRHLADVERGWFRRTLALEDVGDRFATEANPDADFDDVDSADAEEAFAAWRSECGDADRIIATRGLDDTGRQHTGRV